MSSRFSGSRPVSLSSVVVSEGERVFLSFVDRSLVGRHLGTQLVEPTQIERVLDDRAIPNGTPVFLDETSMQPIEPFCTWFRHLAYEEKATSTLREYAYIVRRFVHFLHARGRDVLDVTESETRGRSAAVCARQRGCRASLADQTPSR